MAAAQHFVNPLGDPNQRRSWILAYCIIFEIFATMFVGLRLLTRLQKTGGGFGLDDVFVILGWVFGAALTIMFAIGAAHYGYDRHTSALTIDNVNQTLFIGWLAEIFYLLSTNFTKIAVLLFYRRLIATTINKLLQWAIWLALAVTLAYLISFIVAVITICDPVEASWKMLDATWLLAHQPAPYHCRTQLFAATFSGAFSAFGDAYSLVIPALLLSRLQMPTRQKVGLYAVFALGFTVVIAGIVRTYYAERTTQTLDKIWYGSNTFLCAIAETQLALICASAPSLRAIFKRFFHVGKLVSYLPGRGGASRASGRQQSAGKGASSPLSTGKSGGTVMTMTTTATGGLKSSAGSGSSGGRSGVVGRMEVFTSRTVDVDVEGEAGIELQEEWKSGEESSAAGRVPMAVSVQRPAPGKMNDKEKGEEEKKPMSRWSMYAAGFDYLKRRGQGKEELGRRSEDRRRMINAYPSYADLIPEAGFLEARSLEGRGQRQ